MFSPSDITPDAIDALAEEFAALSEASNVIESYRGPVARVRTSAPGATLSLQMSASDLFVWGGGKHYFFPLVDHLPVLVDLFVCRSIATARLTEADARNPRSIIIDVQDETVHVWAGDRHMTASASAFTRALIRARVLEVSR